MESSPMTTARITCFVALISLASSSVLAQVPADLQKTIDERDQAIAKVDAATWDRLTADDFTLVDETGAFMTKAQRLAQFKTQKPTPFTAPQRVQEALQMGSISAKGLLFSLELCESLIHSSPLAGKA